MPAGVATGRAGSPARILVPSPGVVSVVSDPPASPTFNDVPTSDFGYQYIEALNASGITGGCAPGAFCPDSPVTRRQMAIFLSKALGLHWPY